MLRNVESLVDWKQRLNYNRPTLVWRFFPFSHNVHETQQCIELARDLGVDQVIIGRPFDVSNDDPEILSVDSDLKGTRIDFTDRRQRTWRPSAILGGLGRHDHVDRLFDSGFAKLLTKADLDEPPRPNMPTCSWLYSNLTVDAVGRVLPCCISPTSKKRLVYGQLDADFARRWLDSPMFRTARDGLANGGQPPREQITMSAPPTAWPVAASRP